MKTKLNYLVSFVLVFAMMTFGGAVLAGKDSQGSKKDEAKEGKTLVCHKMKKSEADCFPIEVSGAALAAHLAHDDGLTMCEDNEIFDPVSGLCLPKFE